MRLAEDFNPYGSGMDDKIMVAESLIIKRISGRGTIMIGHRRKAFAYWEGLKNV